MTGIARRTWLLPSMGIQGGASIDGAYMLELPHIATNPDTVQLLTEIAHFIHSADFERDESTRFDRLALDVARLQLTYNLPYRRFAKSRGLNPDKLQHWRELPPVPTDVFKVVDLTSFPLGQAVRTFRTSGTTRGQARGRHHFATLELYDAAILPMFRRYLLPDLGEDGRLPLLSLIPSPAELTDSSLSHMVGFLMPRVASEGAGYYMREGRLDAEGLARTLEPLIKDQQPVMILGTAFSFVYLFEALPGWTVQLPAGSRVMETGGLKGRVREISRPELYQLISTRLGVPEHQIVAEYGMTELSSQLYDSSLRDHWRGNGRPRRLMAPPWLKVEVVDPVTLKPVPQGSIGLVRFFDLANLFSVSSIVTSDLGRISEGGLELLGRATEAEARGCSLTTEEMLELEGGNRP